jgi:ankyrin repeat protein
MLSSLCVRNTADIICRFMQENPGRQAISGSFNPIDAGEWSEQAYIGPTERFFAAVAADDRITLAALLNEGADPNRRDHVGRAPLHVAILSQSAGAASDLIDAGARMTARLVDGRSALHLAAQMGMGELMRKMFLRSALNKQRAEEEEEMKEVKEKRKSKSKRRKAAVSDEDDDDENDEMEVDEETPETDTDGETVRMSSEDDWSSDSDDDKAVVKPSEVKDEAATGDAATSGEVPEDSEDEPDVFEVNLPDWDLAFTPLDHAVAASSLDTLSELLAREADAMTVTKAHGHSTQPIHALTLTGVLSDKDEAARLATRLLMGGASTTTADENSLSIFHRLVRMPGNAGLVATILRNDPKAQTALHFPYFESGTAVYPLVSAVSNEDWAMVAGVCFRNLQMAELN